MRLRDWKASGHVEGEETRFADFFADFPLLVPFSELVDDFGFLPRFWGVFVGAFEDSEFMADDVSDSLPLRLFTAWWPSLSSSSGLFRFWPAVDEVLCIVEPAMAKLHCHFDERPDKAREQGAIRDAISRAL